MASLLPPSHGRPAFAQLDTENATPAPTWIRSWLVVVILGALGPYLIGDIRLDQIIVYTSVLVALLLNFVRLRRHDLAGPAQFLFLWAWIVAFGLAAALPKQSLHGVQSAGFLAGLDNYLLPIAIILIGWTWESRHPGPGLVVIAAKTITVLMALNGLVAGATMLGLPLEETLRPFWSSDASGGTVAQRAMTNGRFSGVFNQPAEAGIAYSLAALCLVHLVQLEPGRNRVGRFVAGGLIVAGGILTTSKIFIFGGVPALAYIALRDSRLRGRAVVAATAGVGLAVVLFGRQLSAWTGIAMFERLVTSDGSLVSTLTAGRLGDDSTFARPVEIIMQSDPWFGVGLQGLAVPYDSVWLEAFVVGGLAGVTLFITMLGALAVRWLKLRTEMSDHERMLSGAVIAVLIVASVGVPSLTANRSAVFAWVLLSLLLVNRSPARRTQSEVQVRR